MRVAWVVLVGLAVAGCGPSVIVLKNPQTGELKECRSQGITGAFPIAEARAAADCATGYQAAGWQRLN